MRNCFIGIDVGTSGIRASVIDEQAIELQTARLTLAPATLENGRCEADALQWQTQLHTLIQALTSRLDKTDKVCALAIDGTSSTVIACDKYGHPLGKSLMYNDQQSVEPAQRIADIAPQNCAAHGASSSLAKALTLLQRYPETALLCHQSDWLSAGLSYGYNDSHRHYNRNNISDENNCLKMGYDIVNRGWPEWIYLLGIKSSQLPEVVPPGSFVATINRELASQLFIATDCQIIAGTTDSIAAVIATGVNQCGDAVTSLGSTLVLKILAEQPVFAPQYGIYSHRFANHWLTGGASNSGGRVLRQFFSQRQLDEMTPELQPEEPTGLHYYPLPASGERFPVNDSNKPAILTPRPDNDRLFFQAILEGISEIEYQGYQKLAKLGAGKVNKVFTCGGGNNNLAWRKIRELKLGVPVLLATQTEASYGCALLALQGWGN